MKTFRGKKKVINKENLHLNLTKKKALHFSNKIMQQKNIF
jgi:hypothetical protein